MRAIGKYKFFLLSLLVLGTVFFASSQVFAQGDTFGLNRAGSVLPLGGEDIRVIAAKIIRIFLSLLGIIAVGLMLYAGFTWMTSGGNEEKISSAKKILINATIGLAIIMSSFAITQFILSSLQGATGSGNADDAGGRGVVPVCLNFAECQGGVDGPHECADEGFVVKSLTPRTPNNNGTGMTNTIVRAVFSRPLDAGQDINQIFKLTSGANPIPVKSVKILEDRYVVEAYFAKDTALCNADGDARGCLSPGDYRIEVNPNLVADGVKLQTKLSCGDFDNTANFTINRDFIDALKPFVDSITFNGRNASEQQSVARGAKYRLNATFEDRQKENGQNIPFGGISYFHLNVKNEPRDIAAAKTNWSYYTGPQRSSNDALSFSQDLVFGNQFSVPALYTLTFNVGDIDHNNLVVTSTFVLDGELCHNGKQDAGETGVDIGGLCLGDGECTADWQCVSGDCDEQTGQCVNRPIIQNIDVGGVNPDSWDGAPGSWATIVGNFFGQDPGLVEFGVDGDKNGTIDQWIQAPFANCNGFDVWSERQVIVEIPNIDVGTSTTVRITTRALGGRPAYDDMTTDNRGPKAGPNAGIFKISNNDHPGLCAVLNPVTNTNVASSTVLVNAFGRALGNGQNSTLLFGAVAAPVREWQETILRASVPQNMQSGRVGVRAKIGDAYTNGVEFLVVDRDADLVPHIDSISPYPTSTLESLMTISGARFGSPGVAYLAASKDAAVACATTNDKVFEAACARLDLINLPQACEHTWSNTEIIGKIPAGLPLGDYFIVVKNDSGRSSDGTATITLVAGDPLPGLCRLKPNSGVSPLADGARPLSLFGINLTPNPRLHFWSINHFLQSDIDLDPQGGHDIIKSVAANGTNITTILPIGADGVSMSSGPIKAQVGNRFSNAISYTVDDCTQGGDAPGPNYQCCTKGPEKGLWKPQAFACSGETRGAGYIWRFTTGLIPKVPRVVEACNLEDWSDGNIQNFVRPSPSPWKNWNVGDACTDSVITVQFNMRMSEINLGTAIRVYTCGQGDTPDCVYNAANDVTAKYIPTLLGGGQENILELRSRGGAIHATSTWHRVILGNTLRANERSADGKVNTAALSLQRPLQDAVNGITVAYNFDFKTGNARCSLFGAAITPPDYTTHLLGVIQNPGFTISTNFDNPPHPFYYYVWGRGTQACSVVDVNGKGWDWKPRRAGGDASSTFAYALRSDTVGIPEASSTYYKDVRATVTALQNTLLTPVVITATTNTIVDGVQKTITGSSNLFIQLGDPTVIQKWPECNQSCINATVGVKFNLPMVTSTYRINGNSAIKIQKCSGLGENCISPEAPTTTLDINPGAFDPYQYEVRIPGELELNTLYQVTVTDQIHSFGGILNGNIIEGKPLIPEVWKFRTKIADGICILDKVDVVPNPFVASLVGQKTAYGASALSSPDQCSPLGQRLNPWAYGWNWSVEHPDVATTTHFSTKGTPPAFCSGSCLPTGSDIPFEENQTAYLCGNSRIDPGEDCDIALNINNDPGTPEVPGVSCTLNCLRPGNERATTTANPANIGWCGNGALDKDFGEECDLGIPGERPYCSSTCTWKGSSQQFSAEVNSLQCGNGKVGLADDGLALLGEECDLGISLEAAGVHPNWSAVGCSQSCLHQGTPLSRAYCENPQSRLNEDQRKSFDCYSAVTICGDGNLDPGEECEMNLLDPTGLKVRKDGIVTTIDVASATSTCSNRCILKNICDIKDRIAPEFSCEAGTPGCNNDCTRRGSSSLYDVPSLCGDGDPGIGENPVCEAGLEDNPSLDEDPLQVVTALGNADEVNPDTLMQETQIFARATQVKKSATSTVPLANNFRGVGNYALQCGYVEYPQPVMEDGTLRSNNCPDGSQGVGTNSCCQLRSSRTSEFPVQGAGIADNSKICRNTYIEAIFNRVIDQASTETNVLIASLHPAGYNCASSSETNITDLIANTIIASSEDAPISQGFFVRAWESVKQFFVHIFNSVVHAEIVPNATFLAIEREVAGKVWCTGNIVPKVTVNKNINPDNSSTTSSLGIYIGNLLDASTTYAVVLRGGNGGIKDIGGVGIRGTALHNAENQLLKDDIFIFKTSDQICKIQNIFVDPDSRLFNTPTSTHHFRAIVKSTNNSPIVSTPGYAWEWGWQPEQNNLFSLGTPTNTPEIDISSKNTQGTLVVSAQATITADKSEPGSEQGKVYSGLTTLTAFFCENPWPSLGTYPYEDGVTSQMQFDGLHAVNDDNFNLQTHTFDGGPVPPVFDNGFRLYLNFSFGYCADAGRSGTTTDDLPVLQPVVSGKLFTPGVCRVTQSACFVAGDCPPVNGVGQGCEGARGPNNDNSPTSTLKKFLFFNNLNNDVIGVQVFPNSERKTARQWFIDQKFPGVEQYQDIVVSGYDAITDGNNTYINALNETETHNINNYIYLFGINANAQSNTQQILDQIFANLQFNINIPERNLCVSGLGFSGGQYLPGDLSNIPVAPIVCGSDYDCRDLVGNPTASTTGLCANAKTKFQRDWVRLAVIKEMQAKIGAFYDKTGGYPNLPAGTYVPGYTNTHWPSWSRLLEAIGPVTPAPLNEWGACGYCETPLMVAAPGQGQVPKYVACTNDIACGAVDGHGDLGKCNVPDDQETCWNSQLATFACPAISNVLEYTATDTKNYKLHLPLEYFNPTDQNQNRIITSFVTTTHFSSIASCGQNGVQLIRPAAGACGNGIVEPATEDCDPAGSSVAAFVQCPVGQRAFKTCNATCHYDAPVCRAAATCGNGRIDPNANPREFCDDGNLNGSYGHCTANCTIPVANYCGDGQVDAGFEACDKGSASFLGFGYCSKNPNRWCGRSILGGAAQQCGADGDCLSENDPTYDIFAAGALGLVPLSCSADCQGIGGFCGDGKLQVPDETCDDGNTTNLDGCSMYCQPENNSCVNSSQAADFSAAQHITSLVIHFGGNAPGSCRQSTGDEICRGMGLSCLESNYWDPGLRSFRPFNANSCEYVLNKDITGDVQIRCNGDRAAAVVANNQPAGACGNNNIDAGEVCDTGLAQNGILCTPEYGRSCTYCSADCREVLTRDPIGICGNGKIDVINNVTSSALAQVEACDIDPVTNQVKVFDASALAGPYATVLALNNAYNQHTITRSCSATNNRVAVGAVKCTNECKILDTSECVECGGYSNEGKAVPKLAILNVLAPTAANGDWSTQTSRKLYLWNNANVNSRTYSYLCGQDGGWKNTSVNLPKVVYLDNQAECTGVNTKLDLTCIRKAGNPPNGHKKYEAGVNMRNYMNQQWVCQDFNGFPSDLGYGYKIVNTGAAGFRADQEATWQWGEYRETSRQIESKQICSDKYSVYFNEYDLRAPAVGNSRPARTSAEMVNYGSFFPYPVNDEFNTIQNELVLSPAVPAGAFRVVVKWKHMPAFDVSFSPVVYNVDFLAPANRNVATNQQRLDSTVGYSAAVSYNRAHPGEPTHICSLMEPLYSQKPYTDAEKIELNRIGIRNYWKPDQCSAFSSKPVQGDPNFLSSGDVYVHAEGHLGSVAEQAMTIYTGNVFGTHRDTAYEAPYAVFVQSFTPQGDVPITSFDNLDLTVEVYDYHNDQDPHYSLYLPTRTFTLRSATLSNNGGIAKYWHAFNLVKNANTNRYEIQPVYDLVQNTQYQNGLTVTDFADVLCHTPGEQCSRDQ